MFEDIEDQPFVFDKARADAADLLVLPREIPGTNCGNCQFYDGGYCDHPKLEMNVKKLWCCLYWKRPDAPRASEVVAQDDVSYTESDEWTFTNQEIAKLSDSNSVKELKSRLSRLTPGQISRFKKALDHVSRFSDCGHDPDGDFSKGNTCSSPEHKEKSAKIKDWQREKVAEFDKRISRLEIDLNKYKGKLVDDPPKKREPAYKAKEREEWQRSIQNLEGHLAKAKSEREKYLGSGKPKPLSKAELERREKSAREFMESYEHGRGMYPGRDD